MANVPVAGGPAQPGGKGDNSTMIIGGVVFLIILLTMAYFYSSKKAAAGPDSSSGSGGMAATTMAAGTPPPPPPVMAATTATTAPAAPPMPSVSTLNTAAAYIGPSSGSTYPGNDVGNFSNADPNFCADKCNNTPGCIGFTVDTGGQGCYLKSKFETPVASTTTNAYTKPGVVLPDGASKYQPPVTGHYLGNELGSFANIDPNFCAAKCNSTQGCVAFETDATNCTVKSQLTNPMDTSNQAIKVYKKPGVQALDGTAITQRQTIQAEPLEIGAISSAFTVAPTGYSAQTAPSFTLVMDLWIQTAAPGWRNVFHHGPVSGAECCGGPIIRKPAMFITGNDVAPANRVHFVMATAAANDNTNIITQAVVPPKTWTKVALVVNGGTLSTYINGILDPAGTVTGNFVWPNPDQPWTWLTPQWKQSAYGSVQVRNAFFWPFGLTAAQIGAIAPVSSTAALADQLLPAAPSPPPAQAAVATSNLPAYTYRPDTAAYGADPNLGSKTLATVTGDANSCMSQCDANPACTHFTQMGNSCTLYSGDEWNGSQSGAAAYCKSRCQQPPGMPVQRAGGGGGSLPGEVRDLQTGTKYGRVKGDLDFPGNDLNNLPTSDPYKCASACATTPNCKAFVIGTDAPNCWLKSALGPSVPSTSRPTYSMLKQTESLFSFFSGPPSVTLYVDCNFSGQSLNLMRGAYPSLAAVGFPNQALSAVRVPAGMSITVYEQEGFQGRGLNIARDEACFADNQPWFLGGWWNDKTCSIIVN